MLPVAGSLEAPLPGYRRPVRSVDNLATCLCRVSWNLGSSNSWKLQGLSRPVLGLLLLYRGIIKRSVLLLMSFLCKCIPILVVNTQNHTPSVPDCTWHLCFLSELRITYPSSTYNRRQWRTERNEKCFGGLYSDCQIFVRLVLPSGDRHSTGMFQVGKKNLRSYECSLEKTNITFSIYIGSLQRTWAG